MLWLFGKCLAFHVPGICHLHSFRLGVPRSKSTGALLSYHYCVRWCKLLCYQCVIPCVLLLSVTIVIPFPIVAVSHCPSRCIGAAVASIGSVITRVYPDQLRLLWSLYTFTGSVYCCLFVLFRCCVLRDYSYFVVSTPNVERRYSVLQLAAPLYIFNQRSCKLNVGTGDQPG